MHNQFYISYTERNNMYQLRLVTSHVCLSCSNNLDSLLASLYKIVKRTRNVSGLLEEVSTLAPVNINMVSIYTSLYAKNYHAKYQKVLEETIERALSTIITGKVLVKSKNMVLINKSKQPLVTNQDKVVVTKPSLKRNFLK